MANIFKRLFVPSRFDALCFAVAIHWVVAVLSVTVMPIYVRLGTLVESIVIVATVGATWLAIAATIGWKANSKRGMLCLLISSIASLALVVVWYCCHVELLESNVISGLYSNANQVSSELQGFLWGTFWIVLVALAAALSVWVVNIIARLVLVRLGGFFSNLSESSSGDRTKWLMGFAALLFVLAIAGRVVPNLSSVFGQQSANSTSSLALSFVGGVFVWAVGLFWFPRSFAFTGMPLQKAVSILLVCFTLLPFGMNVVLNAGNFTNVIALIVGIMFVLSVIGIGGKKPANAEANFGRETVKAFPVPSLISCVAALLMLLSFSVPWFYDLTVLASSVNGNMNFEEIAELSSQSAMVKWRSGGRITSKFEESAGILMWEIRFDDDAPSDFLETLEGAELGYVELRNLTPKFDLSPLGKMVKFVKLTDCEISHSQLSALLGSTAWAEVEGKFSVVDDGVVVDASALSTISFREIRSGTIQTFFDAAKCEDQMTYAVTHSKVGIKDWSAIEKVAQTGGVYLYGGLEKDFHVPKTGLSLSRVMLADSWGPDNSLDFETRKRLLFDTDIRMQVSNFGAQGPKFQWKLMMLRGSADLYSTHFDFQGSGMPIDQFAKEVGMAYEVGDDGTIHSLFYPWGSIEPGLGALVDLKVLSFDPTWIGAESFTQRADLVNTSHLKRMTGLEELYFEQIFVPDNLAFLADLKSLKHIQIPTIVRKVTGAIGFDACQSLESVTFLGIPDNKSYHEISRLKNLKRFVIVNVDDDPILSQRYLEKLQEKLPEVEVKIVSVSEFESLIPKPFREYRDRFRKELRADTTWLDEILN